MKQLVIVESPTKARTIGRYLGDEYIIKFSMGHLIDLPKSKLGVDIEHDFEPLLEVIEDKKKIIADLKSSAKGITSIVLATDPDREGEAIAAHIKELLQGKGKKITFNRVVFHEITEEAIKEAFEHPRDLDNHLVDAQTARRVLDRLVGYQISPVLWQKVRRGLSAGRVQSVALRLIVEREREIEKFKKESYWTIHAMLSNKKQVTSNKKEDVILGSKATPESDSGSSTRMTNGEVEFELVQIDGKSIETKKTIDLYDGQYTYAKTSLNPEEKAKTILHKLQEKSVSWIVSEVDEKETRRSPLPPYITSTLQQDASRRLGFSGKRTMSLAQKLYEEGHITYHRTDSVTISTSAIAAIRTYVEKTYGQKYLPPQVRVFTTKQKLAQEAHEGIRPTKISRTVKEVEQDLGRDYTKLYEMIFRRTVSSQMADAIIESTTVIVDASPVILGSKATPESDSGSSTRMTKGTYRFKTNGSVLKFDGFLKVNPQALQDTKLPRYVQGERLSLCDIRSEGHETAPPPRYNDASIIQALEEEGIGRPSTYASIISTVVDRAYVERVEKRFEPTPVGVAVNDFLVNNFGDIDDIPFTAQMEDDLDEVANGKKEWVKMMKEFYKTFEKQLKAVKSAERVKIEVEQTDEVCPECAKGLPAGRQGNLVIRTGRFGKFFSCSTFPDCKFTKPFVEQTGLLCPKDKGNVIIKKTRRGRKFFGCSNYPACTFAAWKLEDIKKEQPVLKT